MDVHTHSLDDALGHPGVVARQIGTAALPDSCLECPVHRVCGAGFYPHRYRAGAGYRNPSVYCPDLMRIIHEGLYELAEYDPDRPLDLAKVTIETERIRSGRISVEVTADLARRTPAGDR